MSVLPPERPPRTASCHVLRARSLSTPSRNILPALPLRARPPRTPSCHFLRARSPRTSSRGILPAHLGERPPRARSAHSLPALRPRAPSPPVAPRPRTESSHRQGDSRKLDSGHGGSPRRDCPNCAQRYWGAGRGRPPGGPRPPAAAPPIRAPPPTPVGFPAAQRAAAGDRRPTAYSLSHASGPRHFPAASSSPDLGDRGDHPRSPLRPEPGYLRARTPSASVGRADGLRKVPASPMWT